MRIDNVQRRLWLLTALSLIMITLTGTPRSGSSRAAPLGSPCRPGELTLKSRGHFFGWMAAVAADPGSGDYVYLGEGSGFTVLDVSDPDHPAPRGGLSLGGDDISEIVPIGPAAHVVNGDGLRVLDISSPEEPSLLGSVNLTGTVRALAVSGSYAYVAGSIDWTDGWVHAVDVSDPEHPALVGSYDTPGDATDIAVVTDTVYVDDGEALLMLDVSNPGNPTELGTYEPPEPLRAVQVISTTAYLLTEVEFPLDEGHLHVVDVSDPSDPDPLGSYDALESGGSLHVVDDIAYVGDEEGVLHVLDVSDPADPQQLTTFDVGWSISSIVTSGARAYLASAEHGLIILDVSDPANPVPVGDHERPSAVMDIIVDYPSGYIAGFDKVWAVDLTDPILPVPVGSRTLQDVEGTKKQLALTPHPQSGAPLVYVAEQLYGLEIFDMTEPMSPTLVGEYPTPGGGEMTDVSVVGDHGYALTVNGGDGRLHILDVSDPSDPSEADIYDTPGDARSIIVTELITGTSVAGPDSVAQTMAFVADGAAGLRLIDVSDPSDATAVQHIDPPAGATTDLIVVTGTEAYVGSNTGSTWHLQAFDVTDPLSPTFLAEQEGSGHMNDLDVDDEHVYVAVTVASPAAQAVHPPDSFAQTVAGQVPMLAEHARAEQGAQGGISYYSRAKDGDESLKKKGSYQAKNAKSTLTFSVLGYTVRITYIDKGTLGAEVVGPCGISARIEPPAAQADGCTLSPLGLQECECDSDEEFVFEHEAVNGWEWNGLNPPPPITCPDEGVATVIGQFSPFIDLSGSSSTFVCSADENPPVEERTKTVLQFTLTASQADTWGLTSLTFQASGDGNDAANIADVHLYHESTQIGAGGQSFSSDDGTVTFTFPKIIIATTPESFHLEYVFDFEGLDGCSSEAKEFNVSVVNLSAGLEPENYKPGKYHGGAAGATTVGCVMHEETNEAFDTIQEAVDAAGAGTTISLCPGTYEENVDVEESVTIQSLEGRDDTIVQAADGNDHVFHVKKNDTTIQGLTIEGATGADRAGVYVHGSTVQNPWLLDNLITDNRYGIYLQDVERAEIWGNVIWSNTASGIRLESSTDCQIESNSIYRNDEDGVYLEGCENAAGQETTIAENSVSRNDRHGVQLHQSRGVDIEHNVSLSENGQNGVLVDGSQDVSIADNPIIKENGKDGISLDGSKGVEIEGNSSIEENVEKGISLYNCQSTGGADPIQILGNTIAGNRAQGKQVVGVYLDNSTGAVIGSKAKPNTIRSHTSYGVGLVNSATDNTIEGNTLKWNDEAGIHIGASCGNTVDQNTLGPENGHGVRIEASHCAAGQPNVLTSNTIEESAEHGIYLTSSYGNQIGVKDKGNTVRSNDGSGITLQGCEAPSGQENEIEANTVQNNVKHGIHLENSRRNSITDGNDISGNGEDGVYLISSDASVVSGNTIHGEGRQKHGITIGHTGDYADPTEITDNTIHGHPENGIRLYGACKTYVGFTVDSPATVKKNTIGPNNEEAGIRVEHSTCSAGNENVIGGNRIHQNPYGIMVVNSAGTRVEKVHGLMNEIEENDKDGVYITKSSRIEVAGNLIRENQGAGIHLVACETEAGQENEIRENLIRKNSSHGIHLEQTQGTIIGEPGHKVNTIRSNSGNGIHLEQCTSATDGGEPLNTVINNTIKDDNNHGIYLIGSRFNLIQDNEVRANHKNGIHLKGSSFNQIYGNEDVAENQWYGIYLSHNSQKNEIAGNRLVDNKMAGIFLKEAHYNFIPQREGEPNVIEENDEDGIRIDAGQGNIIRNNTIRKNGRDGLRLSDAHQNEVLGKITIRDNEGHGVYLERSQLNRFEGPLWMEVGVTAPDFVDYQAVIRDNDDYGIYFRDRSHANRLINYAIAGHGVCMRIDNSSSIHFEYDLFFSCNLGVRETNSRDNAYSLQRFEACHVPYRGLTQSLTNPDGLIQETSPNVEDGTALHLENSSPQIQGCSFFDNEGDGIRSESGSEPVIRTSNIYDNEGVGLNNLDSSVTVDARDNWWGAPNGPGGEGAGDGDEVSGSVDFADWRPVTVTLVTVAREDPLLAARGVKASNQVRIRNWEAPTDTVGVSVADAQGWLMGPRTFTVTLNADSSVPVTVTVPSTAPIGLTNQVTVTTASQGDPTVVDTTSFQVATALMADLVLKKESPETVDGQEIAYTIVVTNTGPDSASSVTITDTLPLTATVVSVDPDRGTCAARDGILICEVGTLASGERTTVALVVRANNDDGLYTMAEVSADEHDPDPSNNFGSAHTALLLSCLYPLQDLSVAGPTYGYIEAPYAFTAVITPGEATEPITYTWSPSPQSGQRTPSAEYRWTTAGVHTITLKAENCGDAVSDTHTITIADNAPPVANAGPDQHVPVGENVTLDGSGSADPDGHLPLAFGWSQTGGPEVTLSDAAAISPTFTAPTTPAMLSFALVVTDAYGLASVPDTVEVTVSDIPIVGLEAANSSPTPLARPTLFTATLAAGTNVSYQWAFGDGHIGVGQIVTHTYTAASFYTAVVTASNGIHVVTAATPVTVTNQLPIADAGPDETVTVGDLVTLDGSGSTDPDGHLPLAFDWSQTGGPEVTLSDASAISPTFTAPTTPTVLTFTLTVTDVHGLASLPETVAVDVQSNNILLPLVARDVSSAASRGVAGRNAGTEPIGPVFLPPPLLRDRRP